jgi:predicted RecA/RadA family phage recombinase
MKNYVQPGDAISLAFPYARVSGEIAKQGNILGVAADTVASGATGVLVTAGVYSGIVKNTGAGEASRWGSACSGTTPTSASPPRPPATWRWACAVVAAATGDATVRMLKLRASTPAGT